MAQSLQDRILAAAGGAYELLYHGSGTPYAFPLRAEFSNWRDEQRAWRDAAIFQDMSHHMCNVTFEGPGIIRLLARLGTNSFSHFSPMQAKQYVVCNDEGYYIGDAILTCEAEGRICIVGKPSVANWIRFHLETESHDARLVYWDPPSPSLRERKLYRFQLQGPVAHKIFETLNGGSLPEIGFFKMGRMRVGAHEVTALNHRMSGAPGYEIWGDSAEGEDVMEQILTVGARYGLRQLGGRNYPVTAVESGWIGSALPAIYTSDSTRLFREWLPARSYEGEASIGGSYPRGLMEELYVTPYDLGYGSMIKFDHDFHGRSALEEATQKPMRRKVRLRWNREDALEIHSSALRDGKPYKFLDMPVANYCTFQMDEVLFGNRRIGVAFYPAYSFASREWISLACVEEEHAKEGAPLTVTWGEPNGGSRKPTVERHVQRPVRVIVDTRVVNRA